eukprot:365296-Chlamydomonas_euryale.AAC.2
MRLRSQGCSATTTIVIQTTQAYHACAADSVALGRGEQRAAKLPCPFLERLKCHPAAGGLAVDCLIVATHSPPLHHLEATSAVSDCSSAASAVATSSAPVAMEQAVENLKVSHMADGTSMHAAAQGGTATASQGLDVSGPSALRSSGGDSTTSCLLQFVNSSESRVHVAWVNFGGDEVVYHTLDPGSAAPQRETWCPLSCDAYVRIKVIRGVSELRKPGVSSGNTVYQLLTAGASPAARAHTCPFYASGPNARLIVNGSLHLDVCSLDGYAADCVLNPDAADKHPQWGCYKVRGTALGLGVKAFDCVGDDAVHGACHIISCMLQEAPRLMVQRMVEAGVQVAIIGREQVTTDIPEHSYLKLAKGLVHSLIRPLNSFWQGANRACQMAQGSFQTWTPCLGERDCCQ